MTKEKPPKTAADLLAKLSRDQAFDRRRMQREMEHERLASELSRAEAPLVRDLVASGENVDSVWDLVNTSRAYPSVVQVLLDHLRQPYPAAIREGIGRALATPHAARHWDAIKHAYEVEQEPRAQDGLAVALAAIADDTKLDEILALVKDRSNGASRIFLLKALARSEDRRARAALMDAGTDPDLADEAQHILRKKR